MFGHFMSSLMSYVMSASRLNLHYIATCTLEALIHLVYLPSWWRSLWRFSSPDLPETFCNSEVPRSLTWVKLFAWFRQQNWRVSEASDCRVQKIQRSYPLITRVIIQTNFSDLFLLDELCHLLYKRLQSPFEQLLTGSRRVENEGDDINGMYVCTSRLGFMKSQPSKPTMISCFAVQLCNVRTRRTLKLVCKSVFSRLCFQESQPRFPRFRWSGAESCYTPMTSSVTM